MTLKARGSDNYLRFGIMWPNTMSQNITSRAVAEANPDVLDLRSHVVAAQSAESAGFDYLFFADTYAANAPANIAAGHGEPRLYAPVWAAALLAATEHIGVVTTLHMRYLPPVVIARLGANLDALGGGRWGWNAVPGAKASEHALFGLSEETDYERRYRMARESIRAVKAFWSAGTGDRVDVEGEFFGASGVLAGPRPSQRPYPPIFNPGVSPAAMDLIVAEADYGFTAIVDDLEEVAATARALSERAAAAGRDPKSVEIAGSIAVVLGDTESAAEANYRDYLDSVDLEAAEGFASFFLNSSSTYQRLFAGMSKDDQIRRIGAGAGSTVLVGTPEQVAERFSEIRTVTGVRQFLTLPFRWGPDEFAAMADVFTALRRRGDWIHPSERGWTW
ncbi:LLM class flavin-dependent oxidoreductase [Leucobacter allii]|uniref:LLM class flavin-dependent oxidoreductase n=1 Tax=Leucobacter allii TaxID=2932247 RepID=UPI001FD5F51F|nr:LLM class flavin-dependent oxidoreductase [Leucobacter allii]UOR01526.1 LLM class flavin-dependent oxidoreductase [Leucobacter allii]